MGAKASLHMSPMKSMDAALSDENERRGKNKEWFDRGTNSKGVPYHYDWWRRNLNFEIVKGKIVPRLSQEIPLHERLQKRLHELGFKNYKAGATNAPNVCMDFVIGGDHERLCQMAFKNQRVNFESPDHQNADVQRDKEIENWALDTYRWLAKKYGEENIVGFNVHLDETTPHIHVQIIPVGNVQKRGRLKPGEERGTVMAVSYASVVGKEPEELAAYLDNLHTDYHLQVGHKYGLERGTFFDDLTPEEQAQRKHRTKAEYIAYIKEKKELEESKKMNATLKEENTTLKEKNENLYADFRQAERRMKGLTTMVNNLEERQQGLLADIAALEDIHGNTEREASELQALLEEKRKQLTATTSMLDDKKEKLSEASQQLDRIKSDLKKLDETKMQTAQDIKKMADNAIKLHERQTTRMKEADRVIADKRAEVARIDKTGELNRAYKHIKDRDAVIYRHWPEAQAAVKAIYERASSMSAREFTQQQALDVEKAIGTSGISRNDAANELLSLTMKEFDNNRTWHAWIEDTANEVLSIAQEIHFLTPFLQQYSNGGGGGVGNTDLPKKKEDDRNTGYQAMKPKGRK